jgi:hypothetical protein
MMDDTVYDGTGLPPEESSTQEQAPEGTELQLPEGSREEQLAWIRDGDTFDDRSARATLLWESVGPEGQTAELSAELMGAAYQQEQPQAVTPEQPAAEDTAGAADAGAGVATGGDGPSYEETAASGPDAETVTAEPETVAASPDSQVPGELVQSDVAGTGEAVNAETGEVTPPGQPLPAIEQDSGEQLQPAPTDTSAATAEPAPSGQATESADQAAEGEQQTPPGSTD